MPEVFNNEVLCKRVIKIPLPDYMLNLVETVVITGRNEVVAMVIYLHLSVIHSVQRGGLPQCMLGYHHPPGDPPGVDTPQDQTPPRADTPPMGPPWDQTPPGADTTPSPGSRLAYDLQAAGTHPIRMHSSSWCLCE